MRDTLRDIGLLAVVGSVLAGPFVNKTVERNLEAFLFVMGAIAVSIAGAWKLEIVTEALEEPVVKGIVPAVLAAGLLFAYGRRPLASAMSFLSARMSVGLLVFLIVVLLGLVSSLITAIIAALVLVELMYLLPLDRRRRVGIVVTACFSIGLGAALTPLGEPLTTIAIANLKGEPYQAGFFFMFQKAALYILPGIVAFGLVSVFFTRKGSKAGDVEDGSADEALAIAGPTRPWKEVATRTAKVYVFVMALVLLGSGVRVLIEQYLVHMPPQPLYWVNISSAILDNATLTAAEIGPSLRIEQITGALLGLLIAGGMLIPGNIPNIISANKLGITSKEWARIGLPIGLVAMVVYFVWLYYLP